MTRRTRMGALQTLGRGVDRMAPGGRRSAAESPIRPFSRPVGVAGEQPATPTEPFGFYGTGRISDEFGEMTGGFYWQEPRTAGDVLVMTVLSRGTTLAIPGWATLGSGTMTGTNEEGTATYSWRIAWGVSTGGTGAEGSMAGYDAEYTIGYGYAFHPEGTTPHLVGPRTAGPGATTVEVQATAGAGASPVQTVLVLPNGSPGLVGETRTYTPPSTASMSGSRLLRPLWPATSYVVMQIDMPYPPSVHPNVPQYMTTPDPCSFVTFTWGFS